MAHLFINHWKIGEESEDEEEVTVVSREEWGALPPAAEDLPVKLPVKVVMWPHTRTGKCQNRRLCCNLVRDIQKRHMAGGYPDILYNFLIGGDGNVYEGRGFKMYGIKYVRKLKLYTKKIDIAFIGDFAHNDKELPSEHMERTADLFVKKCIKDNLIVKKFKEIPIAYNSRGIEMFEPLLDADFPQCDQAGE